MEETHPLPDYAADYLDGLVLKNRQPSTIKRYTYDLEDFFRWMKKKYNDTSIDKWQNLTGADLDDFFAHLIDERHYTSSTVNRILTVLKQLYRFQAAKGAIYENPMENMTIAPGTPRALIPSDFMTGKEKDILLAVVPGNKGLTENQLKGRHLLIDRNLSIFYLLMEYGLTLHELASLKMKDMHFEDNTLFIPSVSSRSRRIPISTDVKKQIYKYIKQVPDPVRPRYKSHDPLFAAFDFQRLTYRWVYETEQPKGLTEIAIQKMIREEVKRAELRKGLSAQHMRNSAVLTKLLLGWPEEKIMDTFGFKTPVSLRRYQTFLHQYEDELELAGGGK
ncbi:tyrosine-type recombinase/integrase [Bacillus marinisedimentorum]|uniref:tyrosine-type recombinase/integrase n=1 Tax=Bacillus marinisedimentorum TaxID=1821260 RepID=UPI0007E23CAE|nr:phage integrase N-terminal SAM-like domain-containing protein [Bacillus marinisedimentorum]